MQKQTTKPQPKLIFEGARKIHGAIQTIPRTDLEKKKMVRQSGIISVYTGNTRSREEIKSNSEARRLFLKNRAATTINPQTKSFNKLYNFLERNLTEMLAVQGNAD